MQGVRSVLVLLTAMLMFASDGHARGKSGGKTRAPAPAPLKTDRLAIPAGQVLLGSNSGALDERPQRPIRLPAFHIDRTEVTRAMYARCVASGGCAGVGDLDRTTAAAPVIENQDLPMTGVTWAEAAAFCRFARGRLPTEAEWEKAARGDDARDYPWGDEPACDRGNWGNYAAEGPCAGQAPGHPVEVGRYPSGASPHGVLDMAGNVWEWVEDRYPQDPDRRMVKGGSCCSFFVLPRIPNRNGWAADHRDEDLGFRCVGRKGS